MVPNVFLDQYRISTAADGTPVEMARNGPAITYKGSDLKSGAPVAITVIPTSSVDPAERERFEQKARTAMLLDHVNIAKTTAFSSTDDSLVFVSEYPQGESVEAWVKVHGPMPPDAVLRVALQVVSALGAASFHGLNHPAIHPANLVIMTGKTAEGGWPLIKLTHFALSGLKSAPGHAEPDVSASDYASPEQLLQGTVDFRSEIYSLGATMCFLLTGVFYSAYPRSPQTKRFRGPLRKLVARTLEDDPQLRPHDPVLFTEELRTCLTAVERRQRLQREYGMPLAPIVKRPKKMRRFRVPRPVPLLASIGRKRIAAPEPVESLEPRPRHLRPAWAVLAALLAVGLMAALLLPEDVVTAAFRRHKSPEMIGVPIGVPESSPATVATSESSNAASPATEPGNTPATEIATNLTVARNQTSAVQPAASDAPATASAASVAPMEPPGNAPPEPAGVVAQNASSEGVLDAAAAPNQSPATIAQSKTSTVPPAETSAVTPVADATVQSTVPSPQPTPAVVAANNIAPPEMAPPAEAPDEKSDSPTAEQAPTNDTAASATASGPDTEGEARLTTAKPSPAPATRTQKPRTKRPAVAQGRASSRRPVPRALPVEPDDAPPVERVSFRARVVGITPNGNVILALPNGERAIVAPQDAEQYSRDGGHRRPRRVIIERRVVIPPQYNPPYQPFLPPGT